MEQKIAETTDAVEEFIIDIERHQPGLGLTIITMFLQLVSELAGTVQGAEPAMKLCFLDRMLNSRLVFETLGQPVRRWEGESIRQGKD